MPARKKVAATDSGAIRVGIGGWLYPPWRGVFYPADLAQQKELEFASRAVTAIEINSTFYRLQTPAVFAKWAASVPEDFVFSLKASRFCSNRRNLADAAAKASMDKYFAQGLEELGDRLGPILWQLMPTKRFDAKEIEDFLAMLPKTLGRRPLRHALEARHESFLDEAFPALLREAGVASVFADSDEYPRIADCTADFVYARLRSAREDETEGYSKRELDAWADAAREWAAGRLPAKLPLIDEASCEERPREVFLFVINGAKLRAPAAARALLGRLSPSALARETKSLAPRKVAASRARR